MNIDRRLAARKITQFAMRDFQRMLFEFEDDASFRTEVEREIGMPLMEIRMLAQEMLSSGHRTGMYRYAGVTR